MKTTYQVRFVYYQYNNGSARNGNYSYYINCESLEKAVSWKNKIDKMVKCESKSRWFFENFHIDGYPEYVEGIYKITEERIN